MSSFARLRGRYSSSSAEAAPFQPSLKAVDPQRWISPITLHTSSPAASLVGVAGQLCDTLVLQRMRRRRGAHHSSQSGGRRRPCACGCCGACRAPAAAPGQSSALRVPAALQPAAHHDDARIPNTSSRKLFEKMTCGRALAAYLWLGRQCLALSIGQQGMQDAADQHVCHRQMEGGDLPVQVPGHRAGSR